VDFSQLMEFKIHRLKSVLPKPVLLNFRHQSRTWFHEKGSSKIQTGNERIDPERAF
jgi:hypothetical protein